MKRKLIEVALPLEAINRESAREKSIRHGHPSTLHLWWARRPLAACRAVLWASLVDDPSSHPDRFPTEAEQEVERKRLFGILEELVRWENINNETVLAEARAEILASTDGHPPPVLDPFCGGGSIPLEAQRLGLEAHASDLNPVAVLITKALIEIPPKFAGQPPVHPQEGKLKVEGWKGAAGLAEDVRYYGEWMRTEAEKRIGHLYPKAKLPNGAEATVIAWLWARTVTCPNPACGATMPLVRSFALSTKKGKEAWVEPIIDQQAKTVGFKVKTGKGKVQEGTVNRRGARCVVCNTPVPLELIRVAGKNGHLGASMIAIVAEGNRGRIYIDTDSQDAEVAGSAEPSWAPEDALTYNPRYMAPPLYGMTRHRDLFTGRQLVALTTFSDLVGEGRRQVLNDASDAGLSTDAAAAYADSVATYLALSVDRLAMTGNSLVRWNSVGEKAQHAFGRQALPMVWDYAEPNFLGTSTGAASAAFELAADSIEQLPASVPALVRQRDATAAPNGEKSPLVCTDPPYYDNIGYADLSDFFYVWLRRSLKDVDPDLFSTLLTPKAEELVATPYRFEGSRKNAEEHFESGLSKAFAQLRATESGYPTTVFYAFKQSEEDDEVGGLASTGWETMLTALIDAGFSVVGTWPMRTEMKTRQVAMGTNALASSIVLVCRPRANTGVATRRDFVSALRAELPEALRTLQHGNIAPVDLAQASIGPGMAVFTGFSRVREADDSTMTVRSALALINQVLDEILTEQEGDFDAETRWAVAWFDQHGMDPGPYGEADVLARAKDTATNAMVDAGILASRGGKVRLLGRDEHPSDWDPATDQRLTVWEVTQHLVRTLDESERAASALLRRVGGLGETARELAYRLYVICERKGWAQEALAYNGLVVAWPEIVRLAASESEPIQQSLV